jgi:hypothetical protein
MQALYVLWILCCISGYAARAAYPDIWQMLFDSAPSLQHWRLPGLPNLIEPAAKIRDDGDGVFFGGAHVDSSARTNDRARQRAPGPLPSGLLLLLLVGK